MSKVTLNLPKGVSFNAFEKPSQSCPNCNSKGLSIFYSIDDIPVHSCLLMSTREEALKYPRDNLQLGFCNNCGFITNTCFDSSVHNYSAQYEETQAFSVCFNAFAKSLAEKLIDKYDIHNKTILEIGCGKGEFLATMCQLGGNRGIGIDPAYVPGRNPDGTVSRIEFIKDFYSEKYAHIKADVICCRHTLEHIAPTRKFMQTLQRTTGDRTNTLVFFELPDVMRVLREGAFWDIYYEHCSYFTAGSLARLFRASGFEIDDLYLDYDGQYLIITAYPADDQTAATLDLENDLELLRRAFEEFREKCYIQIDYWRSTIEQIVADGQKVVLWGSGSKAVAFLSTLKLTDQIEGVVDINPYKHGSYMPGTRQEILSPAFLRDYKPDIVIVMNPIYREEIQQSLISMGLSPQLITV
jgi:SAM-dependent methyltransferase